MASDELEAELAAVQRELDGMVCHRLSARTDPGRARDYGLLLAREELLLLERRRTRPAARSPAPRTA